MAGWLENLKMILAKVLRGWRVWSALVCLAVFYMLCHDGKILAEIKSNYGDWGVRGYFLLFWTILFITIKQLAEKLYQIANKRKKKNENGNK